MQNAATEFETSKKPAVARARQRGIFSSVGFALWADEPHRKAGYPTGFGVSTSAHPV